MNLLVRLKNSLLGNSERSNKYGKNTLYLICFQVISIIVSFVMVPITLTELGGVEYGIWITLIGIIEWFNFFDIGLGHGLRNRYAEAKAKDDFESVRKYVSTTFFMMMMISFIIFILFNITAYFIDWSLVLNAPRELSSTLYELSAVLITMFCIRFVVNLVCVLLTADQEPYIATLLTTIGSVLSLGGIFILISFKSISLIGLGLVVSVSQLLPLLIGFVFFFNTKYKLFKPSMQYFSKNHLKDIFSFGLRFFLIQLSALLLFQSNNVIIAQVCGLNEVTTYNIGMKYFNVLSLLFMTLLTPLWSATTDAYFRNDIDWIRNIFKKLNLFWFCLVLIGLIMLISVSFVYNLWLGENVIPDYQLMGLLLINVLFLMRSTLYRSFMNGVGKINLQFCITIAQSILHIPLMIYLGELFGIYGVLFVLITWNVINSIWEQIQYQKIINNTAKGLWNR